MKKSPVYKIQNVAIHKARAELEVMGVLQVGKSLEACRFLAGQINLGIQSISRLSLSQREKLIEMLKDMGATVRNPHIYLSDLNIEAAAGKGKVVGFSAPKEDQLRMVDSLAAQIRWREADGYLRFCHKVIKAPRPRNSREVTTLRLALESLISQQVNQNTQTSVDFAADSSLSSVR